MIFYFPDEGLFDEIPRKTDTATEVWGQGSQETLSKGTHEGPSVHEAVVSEGREKGGEQ